MNQIKIIPIGLILLFLLGCKQQPPTDLTQSCLIPKPVSITATGENFHLNKSSTLFYPKNNEALKQIAEFLGTYIKEATGFQLKTKPEKWTWRSGNIYLSMLDNDTTLGTEGYKIEIQKRKLIISANNSAGIFYGIQTLRQLLPVQTDLKTTPRKALTLASGQIRDFPYYPFRSMMLDVSRHFFSGEDVKQVIDYLVMYKMNHFHMHLSDDQGWRIEIKSWPDLTKIGGQTQVGGGKGGYYTQEEFKDIVKYAQDRYMTIIPEIDMPGHTNAALASYAELNCSGKKSKMYTGMRVGFSTLCTDKEITYQFVDDVVREISSMTPGPYFHIGGDESHATPLDKYIPFINRVQKIVQSYGKQVIGWDEIANADLLPNSIVQYWADAENSITGIEKGAKVIMSPARKAYLDMKYDSTTTLGLLWAGSIEVDSAYIWDPDHLEPAIKHEHILGIEAPLWSETVTNLDEIEYMIFPRLPGYAEIGWTHPLQRNWDDYKIRLANQAKRFKELDINYYPSPLVPWTE